MAKAQDLAAELLKIGEENRELLVELRQERKMLKQVIKEAKEAQGELKLIIEEALEDEKVVEAVKKGLEGVKEKIEEVSDIKTQQISDMFDRLGNLFMYGDQKAKGESLETLVLQRRADEQERSQMLQQVNRQLKDQGYR